MDKILEFVDQQARITVGILCKRIETLTKENALTPSLYKALAKEILYEQSRNLKNLISVYLKIGNVTFKTPEKK